MSTSITINGTIFTRSVYDRDADVLYLHVGEPSVAVGFDETPEGHALRFDADGRLIGLTIVAARHLLETEDPMVVTLSEPVSVDRAALARAVAGS
jgi:uncharacterized protein YuzE